jgi:hypothetical protein
MLLLVILRSYNISDVILRSYNINDVILRGYNFISVRISSVSGCLTSFKHEFTNNFLVALRLIANI